MTRGFALMALVCVLASMAGGDYGLPSPSFIIRPAGPSKQHAWVGYGYSDYLPLSIPKPYFIPKWVPHMDPTYTAFWIPETPAPAGKSKGAPLAGPPLKSGFGPPKGNSVVASGQSYGSSVALPLTAIRAPIPPQPLFGSSIPKSPLPLGTTPDPLATYAPAPLGEAASLSGSPPAPAPATGFDSSFVPPKGEDVISNSVVPQSGLGDSSYAHVVLLLVCTLLTIGLTLASYSNNLLNLIIRPAGRSRSFKWLGRGDINNIPYNIPRPVFIPRWIPKDRPEYVAKWVPTTPGPQSVKHAPHQPAFGPPKPNSVVQTQNLPPSYAVVPAPAPAIISAPTPTLSSTYKSPQEPTGYAPPHSDDIISIDNLPPPRPIIPALPTSQPEVFPQIPETAIRNTLNDVPEVPGEPSFSLLIQDEEAVDLRDFHPLNPESILVLDGGNANNLDFPVNIVPAVTVTNEISNTINPAEPNIILTPAEPDNFLFTDLNQASPVEFGVHKGTVSDVVNDPIFILNPDSTPNPFSTTFLNDAETFHSLQDNSGKSLLGPTLVSQPLAPVPSSIIKEPNLETLFIEDASQPLDPVPSSIIKEPNLETLFIEDVPTEISQDSIVSKLNTDTEPNDNLLIIQDTHFNVDSQPSEELQHTGDFQTTDNGPFIIGDQLGPVFEENVTPTINQEPQLIIGSQPDEFSSEFSQEVLLSEGPKSIDNSQIIQEVQLSSTLSLGEGSQVIQKPQISVDSQSHHTSSLLNQEQSFVEQPFNQNFQTNGDNEIFIVASTGANQNVGFQPDQVAQFSNFQPSLKLNFDPLPIQEHSSDTGNFEPSFLRPPLIAPPASPVFGSGQVVSTKRKDSPRNPKPSGRSLSTDVAIPQPVPIPIGPVGSVTLDFPREGAGVRQARVASGFLPFGARLHPRPSRRFSSHPLLFGK